MTTGPLPLQKDRYTVNISPAGEDGSSIHLEYFREEGTFPKYVHVFGPMPLTDEASGALDRLYGPSTILGDSENQLAVFGLRADDVDGEKEHLRRVLSGVNGAETARSLVVEAKGYELLIYSTVLQRLREEPDFQERYREFEAVARRALEDPLQGVESETPSHKEAK